MTTPVEMVEQAHRNQLAVRFEVSALEAAVAAGREGTLAQYEYALEWLSRYAAGRVMDLSKAAGKAHNVPVPMPRSAPQTHCECTHPLPYANDTTRCFKCGWALRGHKAEQQHGSAVPAKDAARAQAADPATPTPPRPQGVAGHPQCGECGDDPATCGCWEPDSHKEMTRS